MTASKFFCGMLLLSTCLDAIAQAPAAVLKAGTLGLGLEGIARLGEQLHVRVGVNAFNYEFDDTHNDIDYDFELGLQTYSALIDWFPGGGGFRLSAGLMINDNEVDAVGSTSRTFTIGDTTYVGSQAGTLEGTISFDSTAPYVGLGWSRPFESENRLSLLFDLGVLFQGAPEVDLGATGALATRPEFQDDLAREAAELEEDFESFRHYPVVSLGFAWRF